MNDQSRLTDSQIKDLQQISEQIIKESRKRICDALEIIGIDRFQRFIESCEDHCTALRMLKDDYEKEKDLKGILLNSLHSLELGMVSGFSLTIQQSDSLCFSIELSYHAGGTAGDGGKWIACFNEDRSVKSIQQTSFIVY